MFGLYVYEKIHFLLSMLFERTSYNDSQQNIVKYLKNATLDLMQFLPEDQIIPVIDIKMNKPDKLACVRDKNQNVLA